MKFLHFLAVLILSAGMVVAGPTASKAEKTALKVVYTEWFPYTYTENGQPNGFEIEILQSVLGELGIRAEFISLPWKRCLAHLRTGQSDLLVSMLHSPERETFTIYPEENISVSRTSFFVRTNSAISFNGDIAEMEKYSVGVALGFVYGEAFDNAEFVFKAEANGSEQIIKQLLASRIDLGAENEMVVSAQANKLGVRHKIRFLSPPIHSQKLYVGFSKASDLQGLSEPFSKTLANFKKTDRYKEILLKYGVQLEEN